MEKKIYVLAEQLAIMMAILIFMIPLPTLQVPGKIPDLPAHGHRLRKIPITP